MSSFSSKKEQIEKLNDAFIKSGMKQTQKNYIRFFNKSIAKGSQFVGKEFTASQLRKAIMEINIPKTAFLRQTYASTVLSGIANIVENQALGVEVAKEFKSLESLLKQYSIANPVVLTNAVNRLANAYITGSIVKLSNRDKSVFTDVRKYFNQNQKFIQKELVKNKKRLEIINRHVKSNITKTIQKELKKQINLKVIEKFERPDGTFEEIKRPKTFKEIRKDMRNKFGKQVDYRVKRVVDTEMHELVEKTKLNQHLLYGYTHKVWITAGDSDVRKKSTANHVAMQGNRVKIDKKFRVKGGGWALYPGDPNLPPRQRINCRCTLIYVKA